ncbi:hypothetical protein [Sporosarcina sp. FA15]|uniref:hypothetical protein n=1 Tax=Sporosarcina sp. FA15 TaxID=3413031 RepID=UPI003F65B313
MKRTIIRWKIHSNGFNTTDGVNAGQEFGNELGNLVGANTSEDERLKVLYAAMEKEQHVGNPVNDYAIDPHTGEYIMMNQGLVRVSKDYGPKELSLIDKAGLGVANFLILDDLKTITDPDSSWDCPWPRLPLLCQR